ncbi:MAG: hypothetical protein AAFW84_09710 [Cyanobacteria bacterium J06635_15]
MADISDPFMTFLEEHPDFSESDEQRAVERLLKRQDAVQSFLIEEVPPEVVLDCLSEQGISPDKYVQNVLRHIQCIQPSDVAVMTDEMGIMDNKLILS